MSDERSGSFFDSAFNDYSIDINGLSYEEYFQKIDELIESMRHSWKFDQRVKALKVIIQLAKLLSDTSQLKLFARKFKTITETFDEFSQLVYDRIQSKANEQISDNNNPGDSSDEFTNNELPRDRAKELCRNWFLKVASIRELSPRFYTELTILKACDILLNTSKFGLNAELFYAQSLKRLTKIAWGFGDPIAATYARAYICKVSQRLILRSDSQVSNKDTKEELLNELITMNLKASVLLISRLNVDFITSNFANQSIDLPLYFELISNGLSAVMNCIVAKYEDYEDSVVGFGQSSEESHVAHKMWLVNSLQEILCELIDTAKSEECPTISTLILVHSALRCLPYSILESRLYDLIGAIQSARQTWDTMNGETKLRLAPISPIFYMSLESLAIALDGSDQFRNCHSSESKREIFQEVRELLGKVYNMDNNDDDSRKTQYMNCYKAWLSYAVNLVAREEVDDMVDTLTSRIQADRSHNSHMFLVDLIRTLISNLKSIEDFDELFAMKSFMRLLSLLRRDSHKLETLRWILEAIRSKVKLINRQQKTFISNRATMNVIVHLISLVNDSIGLFEASDDVKEVSQLVIFILEKFLIEDAREKLNFYSLCRKSVSNMIDALEYLARQALQLPAEHRRTEKKRSARQDFLNGCLAFTFVTVPALNDPVIQLNLFVIGARLALSNMSLSLADYYVKQVLTNVGLFLSEQNATEGDAEWEGHQLNNLASRQALIGEMESFVSIVREYEDHIDLRHKLMLASMVNDHFNDSKNLVENLRLLNLGSDTMR